MAEDSPLRKLPIKHWSHSSLIAYLRNPLAWYKRYVEEVYDTPSTPSSIVGRAAHKALQHFYGGIPKEGAVELGLHHLRDFSDFEIHFGKARSKTAKKKRRELIEKEYLRAISFYLEKPPRYNVVGVEVKGTAHVPGLELPLKAISDLVVASRVEKGALDIVDHKFVDAFSPAAAEKFLFVMQAIFNYYVVRQTFGKEVKRFIVHECKKSRNLSGAPQLRRYVIRYDECAGEFELFKRLVNDATQDLTRRTVFLPNPSDMFEGENSLAIYRLGLAIP